MSPAFPSHPPSCVPALGARRSQWPQWPQWPLTALGSAVGGSQRRPRPLSRCDYAPDCAQRAGEQSTFGEEPGPQEALGLIFIWLTCVSCSCLKFGSQDTFSPFPFLTLLDLCCRSVGNTVKESPERVWPTPRARHRTPVSGGVFTRPHLGILKSASWEGLFLSQPKKTTSRSPARR